MKHTVSRLIVAGAIALLGLPVCAAEPPAPVLTLQETAACAAPAAAGGLLDFLEPRIMPTEFIGAPDPCECTCAVSGEPNCLAKCG